MTSAAKEMQTLSGGGGGVRKLLYNGGRDSAKRSTMMTASSDPFDGFVHIKGI